MMPSNRGGAQSERDRRFRDLLLVMACFFLHAHIVLRVFIKSHVQFFNILIIMKLKENGDSEKIKVKKGKVEKPQKRDAHKKLDHKTCSSTLINKIFISISVVYLKQQLQLLQSRQSIPLFLTTSRI